MERKNELWKSTVNYLEVHSAFMRYSQLHSLRLAPKASKIPRQVSACQGLEQPQVASRPNMGLGVDASRDGQGRVQVQYRGGRGHVQVQRAPKSNVGLGVDASRPNVQLGADVAKPNLERKEKIKIFQNTNSIYFKKNIEKRI